MVAWIFESRVYLLIFRLFNGMIITWKNDIFSLTLFYLLSDNRNKHGWPLKHKNITSWFRNFSLSPLHPGNFTECFSMSFIMTWNISIRNKNIFHFLSVSFVPVFFFFTTIKIIIAFKLLPSTEPDRLVCADMCSYLSTQWREGQANVL